MSVHVFICVSFFIRVSYLNDSLINMQGQKDDWRGCLI